MVDTGMSSRQFCRGRGRGRGREVEAEARQGRGRELEAEARQSEIDFVCVFDIMHNAHVVVTCSCIVVNDFINVYPLLNKFFC